LLQGNNTAIAIGQWYAEFDRNPRNIVVAAAIGGFSQVPFILAGYPYYHK
jgi:hypothetical protein